MKLHNNFWAAYKREDKPYCIIFSKWTNKVDSFSITFFNSLEEAKEETDLLKEVYKGINRPMKIQTHDSTKYSKKYELKFDENSFYWGYIFLDFNKQILTIYNDGIKVPTIRIRKSSGPCCWSILDNINSKIDKLELKDIFFRDPKECPYDYEWDGDEEYQGWLRFRWGDGKNNINLDKPEKPKKNYKPKDKFYKPLDEDELKQFENEYDQLQDDIQKQIDRKQPNELMEKYGW